MHTSTDRSGGNELAQTLPSAKRKRNERQGIHAWHPYYAGYSEVFVGAALDHLKLSRSQIVLDPWNGSGTTGLVSSKRGVYSLGTDINPVMNIFSSAKSPRLVSHRDDLLAVLKKLCKKAEKFQKVEKDDPLLEWMSPSLCGAARAIFLAIESTAMPEVSVAAPLKKVLHSDCSQSFYDPFRSFLIAALFLTCRKLAGYAGGSNPTWTRAAEEMPECSLKDALEAYSTQATQMVKDLAQVFSPLPEDNRGGVIWGSSRNLPLRDSVIDAAITSPPYLTRIDYAMGTKPELLLLGDEQHLRKVREDTMGAPVIVDKDIPRSKAWGSLCEQLLDSVENHSTKAARSYYLPNMLQYFRDAEESLGEILRVLKKNAHALIVVQSSYFKESEIDLGRMYVEMADALGAQAHILSREPVRGHMAHVNTKSTQYKQQKVYFEDVVEVVKA